MSILIKGMKMPNACYECEFYNEVCPFDGVGVWYDPLRERADGCPLLEVPDHGDLIDRDEAVKRMTEWFRRLYKKYGEYDDYVLGFSAALYFIDEYKAVIPAERSEDAHNPTD